MDKTVPSITIPPEHREAVLKFGKIASMNANEVKNKLFDAAEVLRHSNPFYVDQIVTPRDGYGYANAGIPHVVVNTTKLERNRMGWASPAFGKRADMLVAFMSQSGEIVSAWVESYAFERWNDERHGSKYDERANKAKSDLEKLRASFESQTGDVVAFAPRAVETVADVSEADTAKVVGDGGVTTVSVEGVNSIPSDGLTIVPSTGTSVPAEPSATPGPVDTAQAAEPVLTPADDPNAVVVPHPSEGVSPAPTLPGA